MRLCIRFILRVKKLGISNGSNKNIFENVLSKSDAIKFFL